MRNWLLHATLWLPAILGIWTQTLFATPTLHNGLEPVARVVPRQQQEQQEQHQRRSPAAPLSPTYGRPSSLVTLSARGKHRGVRIQEFSSSLILHYRYFTPFSPSWLMAALLTNFWRRLITQVDGAPDHIFLKDFMRFDSGPLKLEVFNTGHGMHGIPREFVLVLANAMVAYTQRGFCGVFNARVSTRGLGLGPTSGGIKLWIIFRMVL